MSQQGTWVPFETTFERRQVAMWIAKEGKMISLLRPAAKAASGAGGYVSSGAAQQLPAKMRLVTNQAREQFLQNTDIGIGVKLKQYLLGTYDDDIRQGDSFVDPDSGKTYTVEYVHYDRTVETRAELTEVQ